MEHATPVDPRTKEPFSMDDQISINSNITYQATLEERSETRSSTSTQRNSPDTRKGQTSHYDGQTSESVQETSNSEIRTDSYEGLESMKDAVNLMSTPSPSTHARGRSRSPRPVVSAETKARWAMLKSLAGVNHEGDDSEMGEAVTTHKSKTSITISDESTDPTNASVNGTDPKLRPLQLGETAGHDASVDRFLQNLEQDPYIDHHRGFQEGLQVARTLSARSRSRQRDTKISQDIGPNERKPSQRRKSQELRKGEQDLRQDINTVGHSNLAHDVRKGAREVHADIQDAEVGIKQLSPGHDFERELQSSEHEFAQDLHNRSQSLEADFKGVEKIAESVSPDLHIGRDVQAIEHELQRDFNKLGGQSLVQSLGKGESELKADAKRAEEVTDHLLPELHLGQALRKGEREIEEGGRLAIIYAEKELDKIASVSLDGEVARTGRSVMDGLENAGKTVMADLQSEQRSLTQNANAIERKVKQEAAAAGKSVEHGLSNGEQAPRDVAGRGAIAGAIGKAVEPSHQETNRKAPLVHNEIQPVVQRAPSDSRHTAAPHPPRLPIQPRPSPASVAPHAPASSRKEVNYKPSPGTPSRIPPNQQKSPNHIPGVVSPNQQKSPNHIPGAVPPNQPRSPNHIPGAVSHDQQKNPIHAPGAVAHDAQKPRMNPPGHRPDQSPTPPIGAKPPLRDQPSRALSSQQAGQLPRSAASKPSSPFAPSAPLGEQHVREASRTKGFNKASEQNSRSSRQNSLGDQRPATAQPQSSIRSPRPQDQAASPSPHHLPESRSMKSQQNQPPNNNIQHVNGSPAVPSRQIRKCSTCGKQGHETGACLQIHRATRNTGEQSCSACGREGHASHVCPAKSSSLSNKKCLTCGLADHQADKCLQRRPQMNNDLQQNNIGPDCNHEDHKPINCPHQQSASKPKTAAGSTCVHKSHEPHACPERISGESAANGPQDVVNGPQQMLNMVKATSQASIDASGGCPGFKDRK